ncbi:MAG: rhomboid family intramembrane serine protease [Candidatus Limnocylindrales bacterium]
MIPLRDANPTRRTPVVTISLVAACGIVWAIQLVVLAQGGDDALARFIEDWGTVPSDLSAAARTGAWLSEPIADVFTSMFLHGSWIHLLGNMLYLWIFGNNVEDRMGRPLFLAFYLAGGIAAVAGQTLVDPGSDIPMIGASGAIAAALGAYFVLFPGARIQSLVFLGFFYQLIAVPAIIVLGFWFVLQIVDGIGSLGVATGLDGGVAFFAHIGGFVAGAVFALPFRLRDRRRDRLDRDAR